MKNMFLNKYNLFFYLILVQTLFFGAAYSSDLSVIYSFDVNGIKLGDPQNIVVQKLGQPRFSTGWFGSHYRVGNDRLFFEFKNGKVIALGKLYPSIIAPKIVIGAPDFGDCSELTNNIADQLANKFNISFSIENRRVPTAFGATNERHYNFAYHIFRRDNITVEVSTQYFNHYQAQEEFGDVGDEFNKDGRVYVYYKISINPEMNVKI